MLVAVMAVVRDGAIVVSVPVIFIIVQYGLILLFRFARFDSGLSV